MATLKDKLTPKQETYCLKRVLEKLTQRQAYIGAFNPKSMADKTIDEAASRLEKISKVSARLKELQENLAEKAIWSKIDMINDLKAIAIECKDAPIAKKTVGLAVGSKGEAMTVIEERIDSKARAVAVSAIKTAGDMLGYKTADSEVRITINLEEVLRKAEGKGDY